VSLFQKAVVAATHNPVVEKVVTGTDPGKSLAHRFVAGDTLEQATAVARAQNADRLHVSMDLLGEEVHDRETALAAADGYLAAVDRIGAEGLDANISIKLTQLGLAFDRGLASEALERLAVRAKELGTSVTVDMEDSRFTDATVDIYAAAQERHQNLGICLQAYLRRTPDDLDRIVPLGGHIRLAKGAYVESETIAFQGRDDVNAAYDRLLESLMAAEGVRPAIATHDDRLIEHAKNLGEHRSAYWEFQMLYGVRPNLHRELVESGYQVRVYVPYGSQWYAYLTRRLAERPSNTVFFLRALLGRN
jgi:proline dehydrogenase